ncbi:MAG TPA: type II toxin-antitoxin system VapC family toxin [Bryobacteraceae bacterium]|nr:type II toxin-antitoxin system VapC family toxin [Bryobacteraceae bacterium]
MISYLLDTHILFWWRMDFSRLTRAQAQILDELEERDQAAGLSAISLRELAQMIHRGRAVVEMQLDAWLDSIESHPLLTILPLTGKIAAESVRLGDDFPNDPADQIIVATARCNNLTLITADERIRKWGKVRVV